MYRILMASLAVLVLLLVGYSASAQQVINAFYDEGVFAFEDGDYTSAEAAFLKALNSDPENPAANHFLGKTYLKLEQYAKAKTAIEKAWQADPDSPDLAFDRAFLYYKLEQYGKAAGLFQAVLEEEPSRVMAHFYCGVALYRERRYQQANPYLLAAAQNSANLKVKAYYFSGLCHYHMNQKDLALDRMNFVKSNSDSEVVRANAKRWIQSIQAGKQAQKPYKIDLRLAYEYDDNVPLEPTDQDDLYSEEEDSLVFVYAAGEYNFVTQERFMLGAGLSRFQTWHMELDEYDSSETAAKLYGRYQTAPFSFGLQLVPSIYQLDGEDYLLTTEIKPTVSYAIGKQYTLWLSYTYADNDFRQSDYDDRDGINHEVFLDDVYMLANDKGFLLGGIGYEINDAKEEQYDYNRLTIRVGGSYELPHKFEVGVLGTYASKNYADEDPLEDKNREDKRYKITLSLAREIYSPWLELAAEFTYTKNDSNISDYEYTRQIVGIGLRATF